MGFNMLAILHRYFIEEHNSNYYFFDMRKHIIAIEQNTLITCLLLVFQSENAYLRQLAKLKSVVSIGPSSHRKKDRCITTSFEIIGNSRNFLLEHDRCYSIVFDHHPR